MTFEDKTNKYSSNGQPLRLDYKRKRRDVYVQLRLDLNSISSLPEKGGKFSVERSNLTKEHQLRDENKAKCDLVFSNEFCYIIGIYFPITMSQPRL